MNGPNPLTLHMSSTPPLGRNRKGRQPFTSAPGIRWKSLKFLWLRGVELGLESKSDSDGLGNDDEREGQDSSVQGNTVLGQNWDWKLLPTLESVCVWAGDVLDTNVSGETNDSGGNEYLVTAEMVRLTRMGAVKGRVTVAEGSRWIVFDADTLRSAAATVHEEAVDSGLANPVAGPGEGQDVSATATGTASASVDEDDNESDDDDEDNDGLFDEIRSQDSGSMEVPFILDL